MKKRRLIRVTEIIEAAAGKPCVMCQHPAASVGLFIPNDSTEAGAEPVKTAIHQQKLQAYRRVVFTGG